VAALEAGQGHQRLLGAAARPVAGMDAGKGMSDQGLQRRSLKRVPTSSLVARDRRLLVASPGNGLSSKPVVVKAAAPTAAAGPRAAASRMAKRPGAAASRMAKQRQHPVG
jgi:hypothetical protein